MKCRQVSKLVHDYIDGRMPHCDCAELEAHLGSCADCAAELEEVRCVRDDLGGLCGCRAPVDCWESIRHRLPVAEWPASLWRRWGIRPILAVPALAVALLLAAFLIWPGAVDQPDAVASSVPAVEYAHYLKAHTRAQSHQVFSDPDVALAAGELESARVTEISLK